MRVPASKLSFRSQLRFLLTFFLVITYPMPIPVAARSKTWVYGRSLAGIEGSNPAGSMDVFLL
jgi:hypothetical protein